MVSPIDYTVDVQSPFQAAMQGLQLGMAGAQAQDLAQQRQMREVLMQQQKAQLQQQQDAITALRQNPNPGYSDYERVALTYSDPKQQESILKMWGEKSKAQQDNFLNFSGQALSALKVDPAMGIKMLEERAAADRNAGKVEDAKAWETWAGIAKADPRAVMDTAAPWILKLPGGDKVIEGLTKMGAETRAQEMQPVDIEKKKAETKQTLAQAGLQELQAALLPQKQAAELQEMAAAAKARSARLALDQQQFQAGVKQFMLKFQQDASKLPDSAVKIINEAAANAVTADQSAGQMTDLATRLESAGGGYGGFSTASEWFKSATGTQGYMTELRKEYTRLRNSQGLKMLPPGPATDKDIQMALSGFPSETADSKQIASFLRGMAKLNLMDSAAESARAEWVNAVGSLGKPKSDIVVDGIAVPAGTTYTDFGKIYLSRKKGEIETRARQNAVPTRAYNR